MTKIIVKAIPRTAVERFTPDGENMGFTYESPKPKGEFSNIVDALNRLDGGQPLTCSGLTVKKVRKGYRYYTALGKTTALASEREVRQYLKAMLELGEHFYIGWYGRVEPDLCGDMVMLESMIKRASALPPGRFRTTAWDMFHRAKASYYAESPDLHENPDYDPRFPNSWWNRENISDFRAIAHEFAEYVQTAWEQIEMQ